LYLKNAKRMNIYRPVKTFAISQSEAGWCNLKKVQNPQLKEAEGLEE
jgi:hypothetical protein